MRRSALLLAALMMVAVACGPGQTDGEANTSDPPISTTSVHTGFPITVVDDLGPVTIEARPRSIISLSATATEMLFAIGAGEQVVAVDDQSNYPAEAPKTDLSGFTPNIEAILAYDPDLVVLAFEPADAPITRGLEEVGVPALMLQPAVTLDDVYRQFEVLGAATGNSGSAGATSDRIRSQLEEIVGDAAGSADGVTYYHELDTSLFTVTSSTFIGEIYGLLGMVSIADDMDQEGAGYVQLSAEHIVASDPDLIFLADASFGVTAESLAERPGWSGAGALERDAVIPLDEDISSRWGPRVVEFLSTVAAAVSEHVPTG